MIFPPLDLADEEGLLAIGGDYSLPMLLEAYRGGIFPWPVEDLPPLWFAPPQRAVLFLEEFHISKTLRRAMRHRDYEIAIDRNFSKVIDACAAPRDYADGTWISDELRLAFKRMHRAGWAHSVEVYEDGELSGGLYGVAIAGYFAGESMFYRRSDASKFALVALVEHLQNRGATYLDAQQLTPLFQAFGAREIERAEFMRRHAQAIDQNVRLFD